MMFSLYRSLETGCNVLPGPDIEDFEFKKVIIYFSFFFILYSFLFCFVFYLYEGEI